MKNHTLLHDSFAIKSGSKKSNVKTLNLQGTGQVAVVPVQLKNADEVLDTYAYLDNGSCQSLLLRSTATNLNLNMNTIGKMPISGYHMTKEIDCAPVKLQIRPLQGEQSFKQIDVVAVPDLNMSTVDTKKLNRFCDSFEHLNHICFPDIGDNNVSIILGIDNLDLIHYKQIVKGPKKAQWGVETQIGWTCAGKTDLIPDDCNPVQFTQLNSHPNMDNSMFNLVSDWMKIENLGIASSKKAMSKNNKRALDNLENTTKLVNGHYEVGLLWKENADLPNNRCLAEKQLHQLNNKLSNNPELKQKYEETLEKDLQNGYVTKINQIKEQTDEKTSFLPHHPVTNENKPGKVRRVANASSVFQGQSLNSNLLKGPDLLSNLTGVILSFRENKLALSADIEEMFMQVKVAPEDRKFLRFLWNNDGRIETYEYTSHIFRATDSPCIASYALRKTARDNDEQFADALKFVERNIYMDDLYVSTNSLKDAQKILQVMRKVLSKRGFNLTKWNSSSPEFLNSIEPKIRLHPDNAPPQYQKVLGLPWNAALDCYVIESKLLQKIQISGNVTQRVILKLLASL